MSVDKRSLLAATSIRPNVAASFDTRFALPNRFYASPFLNPPPGYRWRRHINGKWAVHKWRREPRHPFIDPTSPFYNTDLDPARPYYDPDFDAGRGDFYRPEIALWADTRVPQTGTLGNLPTLDALGFL